MPSLFMLYAEARIVMSFVSLVQLVGGFGGARVGEVTSGGRLRRSNDAGDA